MRQAAAALLLALCSAPALAQDGAVRAVDGEAGIRVGVLVETLGGEAVYSHRADEMLVLASNQKLFTTAAALLRLPADYRWVTSVWLDGSRLWIRGGGDPSLRRVAEHDHAEAFLDRIAKLLRERGTTKLDEVVLDDRLFDREYRHPLWPADQWHYPYCAPVSALAVEGNCVQIEATAAGALDIRPRLGSSLAVERRSLAADSLAAWWRKDGFGVIVRGSRPAAAALAVFDPGQLFTRWVEEGLRRRGVAAGAVRLARSGDPSPGGELLCEQESAWTLAEAVAVANKDSDNFVTETLLKTLAMEAGRPGSFVAGLEEMLSSLAALGIDPDTLRAADGSGLARRWEDPVNAASPRTVCALLRGLAARPEGRILFDSLPIGGRESKLSRRFREPVFEPQRVHAKTGWIRGASSLSGYLLAGEDAVLVFCIVVNYESDFTARTHNSRFRELQERVLAAVLREWPVN